MGVVSTPITDFGGGGNLGIESAPMAAPPPPPPPPQPEGGRGAKTPGGYLNYMAEAKGWNDQPSSPPPPAPSTASPPPPPPSPSPLLPDFKAMGDQGRYVRVAPIDTIVFDDDAVGISLLQDLLYEDIGAVELANMSRSDLIDGQEVIYNPIRNLDSLNREFNPNTVIPAPSGQNYFSRFPINLLSRGIYEPYFDENGNLVVQIDTVNENEQIEVQLLSDGTINIVEE